MLLAKNFTGKKSIVLLWFECSSDLHSVTSNYNRMLSVQYFDKLGGRKTFLQFELFIKSSDQSTIWMLWNFPIRKFFLFLWTYIMGGRKKLFKKVLSWPCLKRFALFRTFLSLWLILSFKDFVHIKCGIFISMNQTGCIRVNTTHSFRSF